MVWPWIGYAIGAVLGSAYVVLEMKSYDRRIEIMKRESERRGIALGRSIKLAVEQRSKWRHSSRE